MTGAKIRALREYLGMNGDEFGAHIGVKKSAVSMIEKDDRNITYEQIEKLCKKRDDGKPYFDSRYFFDQLQHPEDADMTKREDPLLSPMEKIQKDLHSLQKKVPKPIKTDPALDILDNREGIRELVVKANELDDKKLERVIGYVESEIVNRKERGLKVVNK